MRLIFVVLVGCRGGAPEKPPVTAPAPAPVPVTVTVPDDPILPVVPTLLAIDPALGDTLGGVVVTLDGTGLADAASVSLGGAACTDLAVVGDGVVTCTAPPLAPGTWDVVVTTPGGTATLAGGWEAWSPTQIAGARVYTTSAGVTLSAPVAPLWTWEEEASESPWAPRDGAGLVWHDDKLWLLGGWNPALPAAWGGQITTNEVWTSSDLGATWSLVLPHDPDPPTSGAGARWLARHTAGWLTHEHAGVPYIYVVGGDIYEVTADVWRSADGVVWEQVTDSAPWGGRVLQMVGSYAGDLYVMGGATDIYSPETTLSDVWRSSDGGATWVRLPDAPWAPRGMTYNPFEHDGKLWLIGGGTYDDGPRTFYNDVWSFDGTTWTEVSPDGAAPWIGREYHNTFAAHGELWVSSGYGADYANHNDFWHSADGVTWTQVPGVPVQPGHADGVAVTPFGVIHASGNALDTAVHRMIEGEGALVAEWGDLGSAGSDLTAPWDPARPLLLVDAFGTEDGVWLDGVVSYLALTVREPQPDGRSVFWVGRTTKNVPFADYVNPGMTVIGDSTGSCRGQAGYTEDQIELVVTDALGAWSDGHVLRGSGQNDDRTRFVGFTHDVDGAVTAYIDGAQAGDSEIQAYDGPYMGWDLLGAGYATGSRAQAMLGVVVVVPSVVDPADVVRLAAFSRKWGAAGP